MKTIKTYIIMYHSGKIEVLDNKNPQAALDYLIDNHEYIETIYHGEFVSLPSPKEEKNFLSIKTPQANGGE
tara:strand:+ start:406 stop:618 length:213 start_codon:yes stop_codon:yes gene_type:complete